MWWRDFSWGDFRVCTKITGNPSRSDYDKCTEQNIIQCFRNHPSIIKIKENFKSLVLFDFPNPSLKDLILIINSSYPRKATDSHHTQSKDRKL